MKKGLIVGATLLLLGGLLAGPTVAVDLEPHPHMLVIGLELNEAREPVGYRRCVDLAAGRALPLNAHHEHLHRGTAGEKLFTRAGHVAVPGAPFPAPFAAPVPWSNCEELIAFFFGQ